MLQPTFVQSEKKYALNIEISSIDYDDDIHFFVLVSAQTFFQLSSTDS